MALEEGDRLDTAALRAARRARLLASMDGHGVDVLVLGRPANVRYASGARQLWTAGTRAWAPACVVVRDGGRVHLSSEWDEGVPADIPADHRYATSWDPAVLVASVAAIPGVAGASTIGTDGLTPMFARLLAGALPRAGLVDGQAVALAARAVKTPEELGCIRTAVALAEAGLATVVDALAPGRAERDLVGVFAARTAALGATAPGREGVFTATRGGLRHLPGDRPLVVGDLVALAPAALHFGYEGGLARTWALGVPAAGQRALHRRVCDGVERLIAACRPGASARDLTAAWTAAGFPLPPVPVAHGIGLGAEPPVVGLGADDPGLRLAPGMVLAVQGWAADDADGVLRAETVVVTRDGAEVLSRFADGPLAGDRAG